MQTDNRPILSGAFNIAAIPRLMQGWGSMSGLADWLGSRGYTRAALCTGGTSFTESVIQERVYAAFETAGVSFTRYPVVGEPTPALVDEIAFQLAEERHECVVGVGGGSVLDTAKAVAAMSAYIQTQSYGSYTSVRDFLEGIGSRTPEAGRLGLAAVPTTSGTGSEATKNAVISEIGQEGFKKSLRHDAYVPDLAILDAELTISCPAAVTAASGLDAVTQLIEAYVSTASSEFTDALAETGLAIAARAFPAVCMDGDNRDARAGMAFAAYLSGIALANANLGVVHGAAGVLGGRRPIPHGAACGTLLAEASRIITERLTEAGEDDPAAAAAYRTYSRAGYLLNPDKKEKNVEKGVTLLLDTLFEWQEVFGLPRLGTYGFTAEELSLLARETGMKKTPVQLEAADVEKIFTARL